MRSINILRHFSSSQVKYTLHQKVCLSTCNSFVLLVLRLANTLFGNQIIRISRIHSSAPSDCQELIVYLICIIDSYEDLHGVRSYLCFLGFLGYVFLD